MAGWWSGTPVPARPKAQALARRLLDADIAHPVPSGSAWGLRDLTVVIPVRDREAELSRCLAGLAQVPRVIVVDDCSRDPAAVARVAGGVGARVVRRAVNGRPGAARNTGLAAADTPLVAFLDSDYGTSAAVLEQRHWGTVRPLYMSASLQPRGLAGLRRTANDPAAAALAREPSLGHSAGEFRRDDDVVGGQVVNRGPAECEQRGVDPAP